jgi:cytochrome c oxidase subunit 4
MREPVVEDYEETLPHHPTPRQYVDVAVVLAVITALEVAIYYIRSIHGFLVPLLLFFSTIKFALVALWFMHLRFDSRVFRRFFVLGIVLALVVFGVVLVTFFARGGATPAG